MRVIVITLLAIGLFFTFIGVAGLYRFPDAYTRLHASTLCTTFGSIFLGLSIAVYYLSTHLLSNDPLALPQSAVMLTHLAVAVVALLLANSTESHAIARAAHKSGLKPIGNDALGGKKR